jgi:diguanylate cyclase (GGDEF)-like protein
MPPLQTALYTVLLLAAVLSAAEAAYVARGRTYVAAAGCFALLMVAATIYAVFSAVELASPTLEGKLLAVRLQYLGIAPIGSLFFVVGWRTHFGRRRIPAPVFALIVALPAATVALNWTNDLHHLYYTSVTLGTGGPFPILRLKGGPWYWVHNTVSYLLLLLGNVFLALRLARAPESERLSASFMMIATLGPWAGNALYLSGASPWGLDTSPFVLPLSGLLFAFGLLRYRMVDLVPVARGRVFESMHDGVIVVDEKRAIVDYNAAAAAICRGLTKSAVGAPAATLLAELPALVAAINAGAGGARVEVAGPEGVRVFDVRLQQVRGRRGVTVGLAVVLTDVTDQVQLLVKLQDLATMDELTGLANRRQFFDLARRETSRARRDGRPIAVALMDLDHFKRINDRHGHAAGDAALKAVAATCRIGVRLSDIVGRYGGEELAFVFPDTDLATAAEVAERLRGAIAAETIAAGGSRITVAASFGVACSPDPANADLEGLLVAADKALYAAKRAGRNRVELAG